MKDEIQKIVNDLLINKAGKLEAQRLNEKWFKSRNYIREFELINNLGIKCSETLYQYLNDETGICSCGLKKRFVGFRDGYKETCYKCAKTKNNNMKKPGNVYIDVNDIVDYVKVNGKYSSSRIVSLSKDCIEDLRQLVSHLPKESSISEVIYNIEHNIKSLPLCKYCGKEHNNFFSSVDGYKPTHRGECAYKFSQEQTKLKRSNSLKKSLYSDMIKKFEIEGYYVCVPTLSEYLQGSTNVHFTHKLCNHKFTYDIKYQGHLRCPKCYPVRSKQQYFIYDFLKESGIKDLIFNDRQTIAPKELDISCSNFAIEYDGIMFHSYGVSNYEPLNNSYLEYNNCHLEKTELCEKKGIQLFRIFSDEWENKNEIWKSILNSKTNNTSKIHGRKCEIKIVDNKTAKNFTNKNHMQGHINASIKVGLFYNGEIVSLMTFGKCRRSKWKGENNYELYRFCSKLNTTVVGGASKLIKFFEKNYKPNLLISYANRRWSTGNVYEKIGFSFEYNTKPNYFYFKGNSGLLSREGFQKHKLKDKLEIFNPDLSESQNMYNNGYRKIFDCGNKVYVKYYNNY